MYLCALSITSQKAADLKFQSSLMGNVYGVCMLAVKLEMACPGTCSMQDQHYIDHDHLPFAAASMPYLLD